MNEPFIRSAGFHYEINRAAIFRYALSIITIIQSEPVGPVNSIHTGRVPSVPVGAPIYKGR